MGDTSNGNGAVEFYTGNSWTGICPDSDWDNEDATVVCRQLGYSDGRAQTYQ